MVEELKREHFGAEVLAGRVHGLGAPSWGAGKVRERELTRAGGWRAAAEGRVAGRAAPREDTALNRACLAF